MIHHHLPFCCVMEQTYSSAFLIKELLERQRMFFKSSLFQWQSWGVSFQVWVSHCSYCLRWYTQMWLQLCSSLLVSPKMFLFTGNTFYSVKQQGIKKNSPKFRAVKWEETNGSCLWKPCCEMWSYIIFRGSNFSSFDSFLYRTKRHCSPALWIDYLWLCMRGTDSLLTAFWDFFSWCDSIIWTCGNCRKKANVIPEMIYSQLIYSIWKCTKPDRWVPNKQFLILLIRSLFLKKARKKWPFSNNFLISISSRTEEIC